MFTEIFLGDVLTTYLIDVEEDIGIGGCLGNLDSTVMNCEEKKKRWMVGHPPNKVSHPRTDALFGLTGFLTGFFFFLGTTFLTAFLLARRVPLAAFGAAVFSDFFRAGIFLPLDLGLGLERAGAEAGADLIAGASWVGRARRGVVKSARRVELTRRPVETGVGTTSDLLKRRADVRSNESMAEPELFGP